MVEIEVIEVGGQRVPHKVVGVRGDGACLFHSLSYIVHGTVSRSPEVRASIVYHVSNNWRRLKPFTMTREGRPYANKSHYVSEMSRLETYGTSCELRVAGEIFPFEFELYRDGKLLAKYGEAIWGTKRLRFRGSHLEGHFDVLVSLPSNVSAADPPATTSSPPYQPVSTPQICHSDISHTTVPPATTHFIPAFCYSVESDVALMETQKHNRGTKRRKRYTNHTRKKQVVDAKTKMTSKEAEESKMYNNKISQPSLLPWKELKLSGFDHIAVPPPTTSSPPCQPVTKKRKRFTNHTRKKQVFAAKAKITIREEGECTKYNKNISLQSLLPWKELKLSGFYYCCQIDYEKEKTVIIGSRIVCNSCYALKWKDEPPGMCCNNNKVHLPPIQQFPEPLNCLLTHQHPESEHFLSSIRKYNGCFQMTSFGAKEVSESNFMPTFKVQGQVYHRIGSLMPAPQQQPAFLQIYFVGDDESEKNIRCANFTGVKPYLVGQLQTLLHQHNKYIRDFKAAIDSIPNGQQDFKVVINAERKPSNAHRGRFNAPVKNEVAILIAGQEFERRDIVLHSRDNKLMRISEIHRSYDALQYPLMFCRGEDGYSINIPQIDPNTHQPIKNSKKVSASDFYSYIIMERSGNDNYLLLFRNLLNQFLVDMFAKIETERLNWIRFNQKSLRSEEYVHLRDAMAKYDGQPSDLGKMVVLPSSFTGGPRYMHERTQDAMTYVRHFGRPDLFITFTCNPKWPEITELLKEGQRPQDRHDIVARIFHLKVKHMLKLLTKGCIFGAARCHMYTVEWQKRGLPHVHILLWLEEKIKANMIDQAIRAEIPDRDSDPVLFQIIKSNMIHGPCGSMNRNSPCMVDGSCSKKYPRPLISETQTGEDGYPQYRRRSPNEGGYTLKIKGIEIDNRWVVPYNPVLSRTFSAHINVEYCNSVKSIKYICKYVNKGSDQAAFTISDLDEVSKYEAGRYISSSEAVWRILSFPIHERFPPVVHLAVHLENGQRVYFTKDNMAEIVDNPQSTTLLAFFQLCKVDAFAKTLLYSEVPSYYVWNNKAFHRRKQGKSIPGYPGIKKNNVLGRVYTVHPSNAECYYLRLLLHKVRGPVSFQALKTVEDVIHPTFQSACRALGLLEGDSHWDRSLEEASLCDSPLKIRELFVIILVFCQVGDPVALWEKHKDSLAEDFKRRLGDECEIEMAMEIAYNNCLIAIEDSVILITGNPIQHYGLPSPVRENRIDHLNREFLRETNFNRENLSKIVSEKLPNLNEDQRTSYHSIIESVSSESGRLYFLDAPGGTGKTFLINLLLATVRSERKIAIAVASSGIAATLLDGGKTAHSTFKLPLRLNSSESPMCNISKQSGFAHVLRNVSLIVWDECSMAHKGGVEALDRTLRDIRNSKNLMGGVTVLLAGDFRQTLPVVPRGTRADEIHVCLKSSILWPKINVLTLKINMRVVISGDLKADEFSRLLLSIGDGRVQEQDGRIILPRNLCRTVQVLDQLTDAIYPDLGQDEIKSSEWLRERAILTTRNDTSTEINNVLLQKLPTKMTLYESIDSVVEVEDTTNYPVEFLHSLNPPGLPPHMLCLKVGAPVMLLRNLNPPKLCNGTRLQVKTLHQHLIEATIITGSGQGETTFIPRIPLIPSDYYIQFKRLQFPLKVCYAMTINKAQGQSLRIAGVDLRSDCFSHGQLYVACSRVGSSDSLVVLQPEGTSRNVVYKEALTI